MRYKLTLGLAAFLLSTSTLSAQQFSVSELPNTNSSIFIRTAGLDSLPVEYIPSALEKSAQIDFDVVLDSGSKARISTTATEAIQSGSVNVRSANEKYVLFTTVDTRERLWFGKNGGVAQQIFNSSVSKRVNEEGLVAVAMNRSGHVLLADIEPKSSKLGVVRLRYFDGTSFTILFKRRIKLPRSKLASYTGLDIASDDSWVARLGVRCGRTRLNYLLSGNKITVAKQDQNLFGEVSLSDRTLKALPAAGLAFTDYKDQVVILSDNTGRISGGISDSHSVIGSSNGNVYSVKMAESLDDLKILVANAASRVVLEVHCPLLQERFVTLLRATSDGSVILWANDSRYSTEGKLYLLKATSGSNSCSFTQSDLIKIKVPSA